MVWTKSRPYRALSANKNPSGERGVWVSVSAQVIDSPVLQPRSLASALKTVRRTRIGLVYP